MKPYYRNHFPEMFLKLPKYLTGSCWYCMIGEMQTESFENWCQRK